MSIRKRLTQEESRTVALEAARALLIELGPQAVTLKAVASRIGRTHANLLHHFGSAAGLQKALAEHLAVEEAEGAGRLAEGIASITALVQELQERRPLTLTAQHQGVHPPRHQGDGLARLAHRPGHGPPL